LDKLFALERIRRESVPSLMSFISTFRENVAAINVLGVKDLSGFLLFYIGIRVLDTDIQSLFEEYISIKEVPMLDTFLDFTAHRCKILENHGTQETRLLTLKARDPKCDHAFLIVISSSRHCWMRVYGDNDKLLNNVIGSFVVSLQNAYFTIGDIYF